MDTRTLGTGTSGLDVSALGLGCMGITYAYGSTDADEARATVEEAIDLGITMLDTSDSYGPSTNEEFLRPIIAEHRDRLVIATKFGQRFHDDGRRSIDGSPEYVRAACDASLQRLGVDVIDLYYQHRVDRSVPLEETWGALSELVHEGKVRCLGLSEASAESIRRAHAVHPVTALQTEWSLSTRDVEENGILATVRDLGIGFVAYSPLGRGLLTGGIARTQDLAEDDGRRTWPRFQQDAIDANRPIIDGIASVAEEIGATPAQVALAWVLAQGPDVVPIPGSRSRIRVAMNAAAADLRLTSDQLARLDAAAPVGAMVGGRYPEALMGSLNG